MSTTGFFQAYQAEPSRERLLDLLRGIQDYVYNMCYQILRHPQDAEDASQRVLLKILEVLPRVSSAEHLKNVLARMSFQVALNAAQARAARTKHERSKSAMTRSDSPESPQELEALHRAIAGLQPDLAGLLLDRYFEGKPLERIARDRGCSIGAVWNRLEKAKEFLRQSLVRMGFGGVAGGLGPRLEAMTYTRSPKDLITPAIAARVEEVAQAAVGHVSAATVGAAGAGFLSGRTVALGLLSLFLGASGGGVLVALSRNAQDAPPPAALTEVARRPRTGSIPRELGPASAPPPALAPAPFRDLGTRLRDFRDRLSGPKKEFLVLEARRREVGDRGEWVLDSESPQIYVRLEESKNIIAGLFASGWKDLHEAVAKDPDSYVGVLLEAESAEVCSELLGLLSPGPRFRTIPGKPRLPPAVAQALDVLVFSGSADQKLAVFDAVGKPVGDPWLEDVCARFLSEPDPRLKESALWILGDNKVLGRYFDRLRASWPKTPQWMVREKAFEALRRQGTPEARDLFWEFAREALERSAGKPTGIVARWPFVFPEPPRPDEEDRYEALVAQALRSRFDLPDASQLWHLISGTLTLPLPRAIRILEDAQATLDPVLGNAVGRVARDIRGGETRVEALRVSFGAALPSQEGR